MTTNPLQCPKCAYERTPADSAPIYECPKCGIIYAKYHALPQAGRTSGRQTRREINKSGSKTISGSSISKAKKLALHALITASVLAAAGFLIDPLVPIFLILAAIGFWVVRKAIEGTQEQERKRVADFENMPHQHCMTCGHDFKHNTAALRGSTQLEIALWVLILWPIALIYSIWRRLGSGKAKVACVVCASTQVVPASSPAAIVHKRTLGIF